MKKREWYWLSVGIFLVVSGSASIFIIPNGVISWLSWFNLIAGIFYIISFFIFRLLGKGDDDGGVRKKSKPSTDDGKKGIEVVVHA